MYLFADTETNGKAISFSSPASDSDNWPRITQLAWQLYGLDEKLISEKSHLIKPDGWVVPKDKFFIDNNMSTERCDEFGIPLAEAIADFLKDMNQSDYLIAHNMNFDGPVIESEFIRLKITPEKRPKKFCTMLESVNFCKLPGYYGKYKWPSLIELHTKLFGEGFDGAHDAMMDVSICSKSFFELKKLSHILKS